MGAEQRDHVWIWSFDEHSFGRVELEGVSGDVVQVVRVREPSTQGGVGGSSTYSPGARQVAMMLSVVVMVFVLRRGMGLS